MRSCNILTAFGIALGLALAGCDAQRPPVAPPAPPPAQSDTVSGNPALPDEPPAFDDAPSDAAKTDTPSDGAFYELAYRDGVARAKADKKLMMIDFYTTWCGPCKKLDQITWRDRRVIAWLREKTIALKIDAEKHRDVAARYHVEAYPTLVFADGDGKEIGRIVGYRDPDAFLKDAKQAVGDPVDEHASAAEPPADEGADSPRPTAEDRGAGASTPA